MDEHLTDFLSFDLALDLTGLSKDELNQMISEGKIKAYYQIKASDMEKRIPQEVVKIGELHNASEASAKLPEYEEVSSAIAASVLEKGSAVISHDLEWTNGGITRHKFHISKPSLRLKREDIERPVYAARKTMATNESLCLQHWRCRDYFRLDEAALLLAGIEPKNIKNLMDRDNRTEVLTFFAKGQKGGQAAELYRDQLYVDSLKASDKDLLVDESTEQADGTRYLSKDFIERWALSKGYTEFPKGCPISTQSTASQPVHEDVTDKSKQTYLSIIGALAIVLAELDQTRQRPLPAKKLVRAGEISAKAISEIISKRFEESDLPLKRSNTAISEALKMIDEAEKACV